METNITHMKNQIRTFEDFLLRSKNRYEQERISSELMKMRIQLQKMEYSKAGV